MYLDIIEVNTPQFQQTRFKYPAVALWSVFVVIKNIPQMGYTTIYQPGIPMTKIDQTSHYGKWNYHYYYGWYASAFPEEKNL